MKKRNPIYTAGSFLLAGALTLSMAACSGAQAPAEATQTPSATATPAATAAPAEETTPSAPVSGALPVKALQPNGEFFVQRRNSRCTLISEASGAARVQCNLNAILIFRQKSLTPSLNGRRYTVLYENSAGV